MRLQEIARTLVTYGLADWVRKLKLDKVFPVLRQMTGWSEEAPEERRRWVLVRQSFEELGPTFIKLGQLLSNRSDLLPADLLNELAGLQDSVQPFSFTEVRQIVEAELDRPLEQAFLWFNRQPQASASIAQVHRAQLPDGSMVAVKVQRPDIRYTIETDLDILRYLARVAERYVPASRHFDPVGVVEEFRRSITSELNFSVERSNMNRFHTLFRNNARIRVPSSYADWSSERILTMEYIKGTKLAAIEAGEDPRFDKRRIAQTGADLVLEQIFIHGFFHADPHPGNILVLDGGVICFLDFGIVGRVRPAQRQFLTDAVVGAFRRDANRVTEAVLGLTRQSGARLDHQRLEDDIADLIDEYVDTALGDVDINRFFLSLTETIVRHDLGIPSSLMLMTKTMLSIEAIGMNLDPEFNFMDAIGPFSRKLFLNRIKPGNLLEEGSEMLHDYGRFLRDAPLDVRQVLRLTRTGKLRMGFRISGLEPLRQTLDAISYRLVLGFVLAALLVSSSLIIQANVPPLFMTVSIIGLTGYALAGIISLGFLIALLVRTLRR
ncbi:MAG: AarF/ABC1/UbiB kinase family protein [Spirochaetaceae bacterium]|nr:MAG: AarF/ABC1/UbiB kinase family protein [Spirochaetaceae bacterium]